MHMPKQIKILLTVAVFSCVLCFAKNAKALALISDGFPTGNLPTGTTGIEISVHTDRDAICRYSTTANTSFSSMQGSLGSSSVYGINHVSNITGLSTGSSYSLFVRCRDANGDVNASDYPIQFTIGGTVTDTTPPIISQGFPSGSLALNTTSTGLYVATNEFASCRYSATSNVSYSSMTNNLVMMTTVSSFLIGHNSQTITGLVNNRTYLYFVRCLDRYGNANQSDYLITFSVGEINNPPAAPSGLAVS
jgi:hypothetical protein